MRRPTQSGCTFLITWAITFTGRCQPRSTKSLEGRWSSMQTWITRIPIWQAESRSQEEALSYLFNKSGWRHSSVISTINRIYAWRNLVFFIKYRKQKWSKRSGRSRLQTHSHTTVQSIWTHNMVLITIFVSFNIKVKTTKLYYNKIRKIEVVKKVWSVMPSNSLS